MNHRWKKKFTMLVASVLLMSLFPLGGIEASPLSANDISSATQNVQHATYSTQSLTGSAATISTDTEQRYVITFKNKVDKSIIQKAKGKIKREHKHLPSLAISLPASEAENLKKNAEVQSVEPDIQLKATAQTMDWGVTAVQATYAWNNGYTGKGVKIAVLDSGIDTHHNDLTVADGASFVDYTTSYDDDNGHGTHVAGIIGAKNNDIGVVGVAPDASLYAVKVLDQTGTGYLSDVIAGIDWAIDNHMDIINLSMATSVDSTALHNAVDLAYNSGLLVVAAVGNGGNAIVNEDTIQYPAKYSSVIAVGAVDQSHRLASFSSSGPELEVVAPGVSINSTFLNNGYVTLSGTSMASPFVTGELAILKQQYSSFTNVQLRQQLGHGPIFHTNYQPVGSIVTGSVYGSVYGDAYAATIGDSVKAGRWTYDDYDNYYYQVLDVTRNWPSLQNAKSIELDNTFYYALYGDNTVKKGRWTYDDYDNYYYQVLDVTGNWPSLQNAKSIAFDGTFYYALYSDNTVKKGRWTYDDYDNYYYQVLDVTGNWPSLQNAKSIAFDGTFYYALYSDNTVKKGRWTYDDYDNYYYQVFDDTGNWPNLATARSIAIDSHYRYVGYLNQSPILTLSTNTTQVSFKNASPNIFSLSGTVSDSDNDAVAISATIAGVTKSITIANTSSPQPWTLQWNSVSENLPVGTYSNVVITATDEYAGTASTTFIGNIIVDSIPNVPASLSPGNTSSPVPASIAGTTPALNWTFSDPDGEDTQSAYEVQIFNASDSTLINDSGWINSSLASYAVPANVLARGTTYSWRVAVRDSRGIASDYSSLYYFKTNNLPTLAITSYTDGQNLLDNMPTFTWNYADADGQAQTSYRVQGSRDGWVTVGYDSGIISGSATSFQTLAIPDGPWSFKITVFDGLEWSIASTRNNLMIPNAYEPNDTPAQAVAINYNATYTSLINSSTDVDYFKYIAPISGVERFTMGVPSSFNYDVIIYDAQMNVVATGSQGAGMQEKMLYNVTSGSTYYVEIFGVGGSCSTTSPYSFIVDSDTQAPTAPSRLVVPSKTSNTVQLTWTASSDNETVNAYKIYSGSTLLGSTNSTNYTINTAESTLYTLKVTAVDATGNESPASNMQYVFTGNYQYYYTPTARVDYVLFSTGQKLKYNYDVNGNFLNVQLQ